VPVEEEEEELILYARIEAVRSGVAEDSDLK
jgi:hypothetical protein